MMSILNNIYGSSPTIITNLEIKKWKLFEEDLCELLTSIEKENVPYCLIM
jgi:hypothetical protein